MKRRVPIVGIVCMLVQAICGAAGASTQLSPLVEITKLVDPEGEAADDFGAQVALEGGQAFASARQRDFDGLNAVGMVFVFERDPHGEWREVQQLTPSDAQESSLFGDLLASGENTLAVTGNCAYYVFERAVDTWEETAKLTLSDWPCWQHSLSTDGATIVASNTREEAAYVFERDDDGMWSEVDILVPSDGIAQEFGQSSAVRGDTIVVGGPLREAEGVDGVGAVYVFERDPTRSGSWEETAILLPSDLREDGKFGWEVALDGDTLAVGAPGTNKDGFVYLFERDAGAPGVWAEVQKLAQPIDVELDGFGLVALRDDALLVGSPRTYYGYGSPSTSSPESYVFLYSRNPFNPYPWELVTALRSPEVPKNDFFGGALALAEGTILIGAHHGPDGDRIGAAYVYDLPRSPQLLLSGACPGEVTFTGSELTPFGEAGAYYSAKAGAHLLTEGPCAGAVLDLESPGRIRVVVADESGTGSVTRTADDAKCGLFVQLIDATTCLTSDVVQMPVPGDRSQ